MKTLRDLVKDRKLYSVEAHRSVLEAARCMMEHNIGALPVLRNGELAAALGASAGRASYVAGQMVRAGLLRQGGHGQPYERVG